MANQAKAPTKRSPDWIRFQAYRWGRMHKDLLNHNRDMLRGARRLTHLARFHFGMTYDDLVEVFLDAIDGWTPADVEDLMMRIERYESEEGSIYGY